MKKIGLFASASGMILGAFLLGGATMGHDEMKDRVKIKEAIDSYSHNADRRNAKEQTAVFTQDAIIEVYQGDPEKSKPVQTLHGRAEIEKGFREGLKPYDVTMHFNGQSVLHIDGDRATGETYCLAHHLWTEKGHRMLLIMGIRYKDTFERQGENWLFSKRQLIIEWTDKRPSSP